MQVQRRRTTWLALAGSTLSLAVLTVGCSLGTSSASGPTSTIPSTAFKTIPETPPRPTQPTTATASTAAGASSGGIVQSQQNLDPAVRTIYTVQKGDVPFSIAQKFNVPLSALYSLNGLDPKKPAMSVGMKLKIPRILPPTTTNDKGEKIYIVVAGDSPLGIANKFGIPFQTLMNLNGIDPANPAVYVGQQLKVPG
jgi:LysM repeat protein